MNIYSVDTISSRPVEAFNLGFTLRERSRNLHASVTILNDLDVQIAVVHDGACGDVTMRDVEEFENVRKVGDDTIRALMSLRDDLKERNAPAEAIEKVNAKIRQLTGV